MDLTKLTEEEVAEYEYLLECTKRFKKALQQRQQPMTHEQFLQQYVLNKTRNHDTMVNGDLVDEAEFKWQKIRELCK